MALTNYFILNKFNYTHTHTHTENNARMMYLGKKGYCIARQNIIFKTKNENVKVQ